MKEETTEFRVEVEGPPLAVDQFEHLLHKLKGEGERSGVEVTVERVETTEPEETEEFS